MRVLYDAALVEVVPICRAALAEADTPVADTLYGSAPNLYRLTRAGAKLVIAEGLRDRCKACQEVGPLALGLRHFLGANDVRIWLDVSANRQENHKLIRWTDGEEAAVALGNAPTLKPDAWFVYGIGSAILAGFVEYDRGTERGQLRWKQKAEAYATLFSSGRLRDVTGYSNARVLVIAPNSARRDWLAALLTRLTVPVVRSRFWIADNCVLTIPGFGAVCWRIPGQEGLRALIS